jgi:signal transduction histidine kinase
MSMTKKLVELYGGEIWFDTREGQGTTFPFTLPVDGRDWKPTEWLEQAS